MLLKFNDKSLAVEHKTKMGSLTELWAIGNSIRESKGLTKLDLSNYLRSQETLELVQAIERKESIFKPVDSTHFKNSAGLLAETIKSPLIKTKRGRHGGGTWTHVYILLDAASRMDADFKVKMFDILVEQRLLEWRDDSGDSFKELNIALDELVKKQTGSRPSVALYQRVASYVKDKIKPTGESWNTATPEELRQRTIIEDKLVTILKLGFIKDESGLIDVINNL